MSNSNSNQRLVDRRSFLATFALGAAAAPLVSLGRHALEATGAPQAASLCYSSKRVLSQNDLTYLGAMRVPATGPDMSLAYGGMTGRKVGGQVRLLMPGNLVTGTGNAIHEFADTGVYNHVWTQAPRMQLVRTWGDVYGSARTTWDVRTGAVRFVTRLYPGSVYWSEAQQLLYWTYYDTYNTTGEEDWCLGASRLNADGSSNAYGPWRPAGNSGKKGPWRCIRIGESPAGEFLCGGITAMSGNHSVPWGPDLWAGQFPTPSTPAGFGAPDVPVQKHLTYPGMLGRIAPDGSFTGQVTSARRPGDYFFEPVFGNGGVPTEIDPRRNGGVGTWTQLDYVGGFNWIDLPDVHGVVFGGRLASGHVWYRNAGQGNDLCTHGVAAPIQVTGPVSTDGYPFLQIYDPADLHAVRAGQKTDYTVNPASLINAEAAFGLKSSAITSLGTAKVLNGMYLDPSTRKLYVCAPEADDALQGYYTPLVHVFQIA